jgi:hypothetical protein
MNVVPYDLCKIEYDEMNKHPCNQDWIIFEIAFDKSRKLTDGILVDLTDFIVDDSFGSTQDETERNDSSSKNYELKINEEIYKNIVKNWSKPHKNNIVCIYIDDT